MAKLKIQNSQNLVSRSCFGCFESDIDHHYLVDVGQVVGGEVLPSGLPLLVRAAFDGETDRLDAILVIHPVYRLRKFEPLVTLADGVEQHGLYAAGNDVRKDDAGFLEKDSSRMASVVFAGMALDMVMRPLSSSELDMTSFIYLIIFYFAFSHLLQRYIKFRNYGIYFDFSPPG